MLKKLLETISKLNNKNRVPFLYMLISMSEISLKPAIDPNSYLYLLTNPFVPKKKRCTECSEIYITHEPGETICESCLDKKSSANLHEAMVSTMKG